MDDSLVVFKGTLNGLIIIMDEHCDFEAIVELIEKKVAQAGRFFKGASLKITYRGRNLSKEEENTVFDILSQKTGAEILSINKDVEEKNITEDNKPARDKMKMKRVFFKGIEEGITKFYRGTIRSGQRLSFEGNIVVIGDINPGGEIIASGNVIVNGSLRGIVHAGADGNKEAIVVAFNLDPTQLRIADIITRAPDEKKKKNENIPEFAYVKDETVYIQSYLPQR